MDLTIGEELQAARKKKKISLEEISSATHIKLQNLKNLEENRFDEFSSRTQMRGFLRLVASYLDLDVQALLTRHEPSPEPEPVAELPPVSAKQTLVNKIIEKISHPKAEPITSIEKPIEIKEDPAIPIYKEIGQAIRSHREKLDLSLEDISTHTHIRVPYLNALEDGQFDHLPSPMQVRGLLTNYAEFLSLDVNPILDRYADALEARRLGNQEAVNKKAPKPEEVKKPALSGLRHFLTPDLIIGVFLIFVLFGFIIWGASQLLNSKKLSLTPTAPSIAEVLRSTPNITQSLGPTLGTVPSETAVQQVQSGTETLAITGSISPTVLVASNSSLHLNITVNQPAFLRVLEDGRESFNGRVVAGNAYQYNANSTIELLTGNAAALDIVFNQNDIGIMGSFGEVLHLIFSAKGIQTPTPAFTNTPTATNPPTLTPQPTPTVPTPTITPLIPTP